MIRFLQFGGVAGILLLLTVGCSEATSSVASAENSTAVPAAEPGDNHARDEHDHDTQTHEDHPQSYRDAVAQFVALRDQIRDAFAAQKNDEAHGALHAVGHALEDLPALAAKHTPPINAEAVQQTTNELFDLFTKVDDKMHGAEGADYAEVASSIDAGVERLQKLLTADGSAAAAEPSSGE